MLTFAMAPPALAFQRPILAIALKRHECTRILPGVAHRWVHSSAPVVPRHGLQGNIPGVRGIRASSKGANGPPDGKTMTVATWNVNSVRQRLPSIQRYLEEHQPDVLALQETKCPDENFPAAELRELGYHVATAGQKSYNGVALLAKQPISDLHVGLPDSQTDPLEPQARYIEGVVCGVRICNVYVPNGNPVQSDKFEYRQRFMGRLIRHVSTLCNSHHVPFMLVGDFNCVPRDQDCYDAAEMADDAVMHPISRKQFRELSYLMGLYNSIDLHLARAAARQGSAIEAGQGARAHGGVFSYWDYRAGCWEKGKGLRIDHILLHPELADAQLGSGVHAQTRGWPTPSDHAPVWVQIKI
jgi:exodeoxyribonuclease-3